MLTILNENPEDLITAQKASVISEKSLSTIRSWVRQKKITGYRKDPSKSNSPLMVCLSELQLFLISKSDKAPIKTDKQTGRRPTASVSLGFLQAENQKIQSKLKISESLIQSQENTIKQQERLIKELKETKDWLLSSLEDQKENNNTLQAQIIQMTAYLTLPWWKKWNANVPLLNG